MKVILTKDVKGTGKIGDVVNVSDGFAKNFLLKNGYAKVANNSNLNENSLQKDATAYHKEQERLAAVAKSKDIEGKTLTLAVKCGDNGKVFGSITSKEIAEGFKKIGIDVDKRKIELANPIKTAGNYSLVVKLYPGVSAKFNLQVRAE